MFMALGHLHSSAPKEREVEPSFSPASLFRSYGARNLQSALASINISPAGANTVMEKQKVLIVCTGNVARSQIAEGLLRHEAGDRFEVFSAGLHASYVRPHAIKVMQEIGIDISGHRSKSVDEFAGKEMDYDHCLRSRSTTLPVLSRLNQAFSLEL